MLYPSMVLGWWIWFLVNEDSSAKWSVSWDSLVKRNETMKETRNKNKHRITWELINQSIKLMKYIFDDILEMFGNTLSFHDNYVQFHGILKPFNASLVMYFDFLIYLLSNILNFNLICICRSWNCKLACNLAFGPRFAFE